jgi:hypothetical protein
MDGMFANNVRRNHLLDVFRVRRVVKREDEDMKQSVVARPYRSERVHTSEDNIIRYFFL